MYHLSGYVFTCILSQRTIFDASQLLLTVSRKCFFKTSGLQCLVFVQIIFGLEKYTSCALLSSLGMKQGSQKYTRCYGLHDGKQCSCPVIILLDITGNYFITAYLKGILTKPLWGEILTTLNLTFHEHGISFLLFQPSNIFFAVFFFFPALSL